MGADGFYIDQLDGREYDLLFPGEEPEVDFVIAEARRGAGPVVELACGTGRLLLPLALDGFEAIGVDSSANMLAEARAKAAALDLRPRLVDGDMRDFDLGVRASLIFIAGNSICHLLTNDDVARCFAAVRRHLADDGRFLIDVFVPDVALLARPSDQLFAVSEYDHPDKGRVEVKAYVKYDSVTQVNEVRLFRYPGEEAMGRLLMRAFFPQELRTLLAHHGFVVERAYGDFKRGPLVAGAPKQLLLCRKS